MVHGFEDWPTGSRRGTASSHGQEVLGATRSNKQFGILLMPHLAARPVTSVLPQMSHFPGGYLTVSVRREVAHVERVSQIGGLVRADRRRYSGPVLEACPCPGVRARVLPVRVRSLGKKPKRFPCHPGAAGEGKAGRANSSEPLMTPRYEKPRVGDSSAGVQDPCR